MLTLAVGLVVPVAIVEILLRHGAAVNTTNKYGNSALTLAAWRGHLPTVKVLLQHGAAVNAVDSYGSSLIAAAQQGNTDVVWLLLEHDADINAVDSAGHTALMRAALREELWTLRVLLEHGAEFTAEHKQSTDRVKAIEAAISRAWALSGAWAF